MFNRNGCKKFREERKGLIANFASLLRSLRLGFFLVCKWMIRFNKLKY